MKFNDWSAMLCWFGGCKAGLDYWKFSWTGFGKCDSLRGIAKGLWFVLGGARFHL